MQHDGLASRTVQAPVGDLTQLARRTTGLISRVLDQERVPQVEQLDLDGVDGRRAQAVLQVGQIGGLEAALETLNDPLYSGPLLTTAASGDQCGAAGQMTPTRRSGLCRSTCRLGRGTQSALLHAS